MLWLVITVLAVSTAALLWYGWSKRRRLDRLREESQHRLSELQHEHTRRLDRMKRRLSEQKERGHLDFVDDLLPVLDALGHALSQAREDADPKVLLQGLEMVERQLDGLLEAHGIEKIAPERGTSFDPRVHEAVEVVRDGEVEAGRITECLRPGYAHDERVLRAAAVIVSEQPPHADEGDTEDDSAAEDADAGVKEGDVTDEVSDEDAGAAEEGEKNEPADQDEAADESRPDSADDSSSEDVGPSTRP